MQNTLSAAALQQLAAYKATQQINTTEELFNEVYEYIANDMQVCEREDDEAVYDAVIAAIKKM